MNAIPQPGSVIELRSVNWKVLGTSVLKGGAREIHCKGLSGLVRDKEARFVWELEEGSRILNPAKVQLVPDKSPGLMDTKLHLEAAFRTTPTTSRGPQTFGKAAIDDLKYQQLPVERALAQDRVRLLLADDVGLGKTLEAGLITSELILRGRADRILVVATRAMLAQFQMEFWTRFSIPLTRLDSAAIRRMRNRIPAHYNVFNQFSRSIVSIDTLKRDAQIRQAIEQSHWDLVIIDEAHNAAARKASAGTNSQRAKLAQLLSRKTDSLLLLTATPHDGSHQSFASLIEMLDPTRVPNPNQLHRSDIEDLVVRRFRSSFDVMAEMGKEVPKREICRRDFSLSPEEEVASLSIAKLRLDIDDQSDSGRAIDLFRITLAKSILSSPAACLETLRRRIQGIENGTARGTEADKQRLGEIVAEVEAIATDTFSKYQDLLGMLRGMGWTGMESSNRLVIFSERIATVKWLALQLQQDMGLSEDQVAQVHGSSVEADTRTQQTIEQFGQAKSPIRILIASDMVSEGINLHFQCHRLIHFDLPWSLLRFQQRNGRIDRYGQKCRPLITYFIGESKHSEVRQMWVLEKLVDRDEAAQSGIGDPAVFLGKGDAEAEEAVVAEAVAAGIGAKEFDAQMETRAKEAERMISLDAEFEALFGDYSSLTKLQPDAGKEEEQRPPRLFADTFTYASHMVARLSRPEENLFPTAPVTSSEERTIRMTIPGDMRARDGFGYASEGAVDSRYMPEEAVGPGNRIELTDKSQVISNAIEQARLQDRTWPPVQYLWDVHPILEWFADRASTFFDAHSAPVAPLSAMQGGEVAVLMHGAIPNERGSPVVDRWAVVIQAPHGSPRIEEVQCFIERARLTQETPNRDVKDIGLAQAAVPNAVDYFQSHLVALRKERETGIQKDIDVVLGRIAELENRFRKQVTLDFGDAIGHDASRSLAERSRLAKRIAREQQIEKVFQDWTNWFEKTRKMVDDPNPHVDVKAVFVG